MKWSQNSSMKPNMTYWQKRHLRSVQFSKYLSRTNTKQRPTIGIATQVKSSWTSTTSTWADDKCESFPGSSTGDVLFQNKIGCKWCLEQVDCLHGVDHGHLKLQTTFWIYDKTVGLGKSVQIRNTKYQGECIIKKF